MSEGQVHTAAVLPSLNHIGMYERQHVYEPAEDTFLLCDALEMERKTLLSHPIQRLVEIGSGSGCVITFLAAMFLQEKKSVHFFATDINPIALALTERTSKLNGVSVETVQSDLLSAFIATDAQQMDVIVFNPPYVPTPSEEIQGNGIEVSWAGGIDGREVIDRFLMQLPLMLSPLGICYLVLVEENKPRDIARLLRTMGFLGEVRTQLYLLTE